MAAHSEKGPSSSSRWIHCTPSAKLNASMPEQTSSFAEEGTQAHELCEYFLKKEMGISMEDPRPGLSYYNSEMEECCAGYRDYVMDLYEEAKDRWKAREAEIEGLLADDITADSVDSGSEDTDTLEAGTATITTLNGTTITGQTVTGTNISGTNVSGDEVSSGDGYTGTYHVDGATVTVRAGIITAVTADPEDPGGEEGGEE